MGKNKHTAVNPRDLESDSKSLPMSELHSGDLLKDAKEQARKGFHMYFTYWKDDFESDLKELLYQANFANSKTDFEWLGSLESYATFKMYVLSNKLFFEEVEGDMDARIIGIGIPSNGLRIKRPISRIVYVLDKLRDARIMGDRILLQKLINFNFINESNQPILETTVEQARQRIRNQEKYPKDVAELDDMIAKIVKAHEESIRKK